MWWVCYKDQLNFVTAIIYVHVFGFRNEDQLPNKTTLLIPKVLLIL